MSSEWSCRKETEKERNFFLRNTCNGQLIYSCPLSGPGGDVHTCHNMCDMNSWVSWTTISTMPRLRFWTVGREQWDITWIIRGDALAAWKARDGRTDDDATKRAIWIRKWTIGLRKEWKRRSKGRFKLAPPIPYCFSVVATRLEWSKEWILCWGSEINLEWWK